MARLDTERQERLEPKRIAYARKKIESIGISPVTVIGKRIQFEFNGAIVQFYPYSGWHTGKSIKDGRGLDNLLDQLHP